MLASVAMLIRVQQYSPEHKKRALKVFPAPPGAMLSYFHAGFGNDPDSGSEHEHKNPQKNTKSCYLPWEL
jgi:hypothetical protein